MRRRQRRGGRQHDAGRPARAAASPRRRRASDPWHRGRSAGPDPSMMSRTVTGWTSNDASGFHATERIDGARRPASASGRKLRSDRGLTVAGVPAPPGPWSKANTMAAARSRRSSLVKMCPMWLFTVPSLMKSVDPTSALVAPRADQDEDVPLAVGELVEPGAGLGVGEVRGPVRLQHRAGHGRIEPGAALADRARRPDPDPRPARPSAGTPPRPAAERGGDGLVVVERRQDRAPAARRPLGGPDGWPRPRRRASSARP